jgi:hypothetical protein
MPIHIYIKEPKQSLPIDLGDDWELPEQLYKLEEWIMANHATLTEGPYVADIGFTVREDASGGGGVLSHTFMKILSEIKLSIYFSEYITTD